MKNIYRVLDNKGRVTIPFDIRTAMKLSGNDVLSFSFDGNQIVITKEKICNHCTMKSSIKKIADNFTCREKQELLCYLLKDCKLGELR